MSANPLSDLEQALRQSVSSAGWEWPTDTTLEVPTHPSHGALTTDLAFRLAPSLSQAPATVAATLLEHLVLPVTVASGQEVGGHLNFQLSPAGWSAALAYWLSPAVWRRSDLEGQTVVAEYSSPNVGKPFSVGHLRTTIIGDVCARLFERVGAKVIRVNHLGDWGTQFGKLIVAVRRWGEGQPISNLGVDGLIELYVRFHDEAKVNSDLEDEARTWSKKIEDGDEEATTIWREIIATSLTEYRRLYDELGVSFDYLAERGESFYTVPMMMAVLDELRQAGLVQSNDGAQVLVFPDEELPSTVLVRSDGGTVYLLRDLAALKYRLTEWQADRVVYFVGAEQSLHFRQLFRAAVLVGWVSVEDAATKLQHAANGLYRLPEGRMSSRGGRGILLKALLAEGEERSRALVEAKSAALPEAQKAALATALSLAAIKYSDLTHHRQSSFVFTWEKALTMEGNSAPYLLYTLSRAHGLFRKIKQTPESVVGRGDADKLTSDAERWLLLTPWRWQAALGVAAREATPNTICELLFETARRFNAFYNDQPILKADQATAAARLSLSAAVIATLTEGLTVLGLPIVTEI